MNKEQVDYLKKSLRHIIEVIENSIKDEIMIDRVGKWKCRNGEIVDIVDVNYKNEIQPIKDKHGHLWGRNGKYHVVLDIESPNDLIEFISPSEFTEEGLYEMANGETVDLEFYLDKKDLFVQKNRNCAFIWDKFGKNGADNGTNIIRYLGKKHFSIDKPGVYECRNGGSAIITNKAGAFWRGYSMTKSCIGYNYAWNPNGFLGNKETDFDLVKFISPSFNFEKGEPA